MFPWTVALSFLCPWNSPGKNPGVGSHSLLQGIFLIQRLNLGCLHCITVWIIREARFPGSSAGRESACNAGDPFDSWVRKIPWRRDGLPTPVFLGFLGGSDGKNPPAIRETWFWLLVWEDPLEEHMATHSIILAWRIPMDSGTCWATKSRTQLSY